MTLVPLPIFVVVTWGGGNNKDSLWDISGQSYHQQPGIYSAVKRTVRIQNIGERTKQKSVKKSG